MINLLGDNFDGISGSYIFRKATIKVKNHIVRNLKRFWAQLLGTELSDDDFVKALDTNFSTIETFLDYITNREAPVFFLEADRAQTYVENIRAYFPGVEKLTIAAANRVCNHFFDLLGSGTTHMGEYIDWHLDFISGHRFDPNKYYADIRSAPYPGGYDIKVPWELSRAQHFAWLGKAYWFTHDEKYAQEFVYQVVDWINKNPPQFGVNWACTMDVSIRAINWLWGYYFFKNSPSLTNEFRLQLFKSLLLHGRHIKSNLERYETMKGTFTNNHYLANIVGLVYISILNPEFKEAPLWCDFSLRELEKEMFEQVYPDGMSFEASTCYHRLVTEMFLSAVILARLNGYDFSPQFMERLEKMLEFVMYINKPDNTVPLIGDSDNGRLHRLKIWGSSGREWVDHRYLLAIGAVLFDREDFGQMAGDQWEEALWLFGEMAIKVKPKVESHVTLPLTLESRAFPDSGIYIMRNGTMTMVIDSGPVGQNGRGGHAHNDTLSFELCVGNQSCIIDPGSYIYTQNYNARNQFRSTANHNNVMVDGHEINQIKKDRLFSVIENDYPKIHRWTTTDNYDLLEASHRGYEQINDSITYRRQFFLDKQESVTFVRDLLYGNGRHKLEWRWFFSPLVNVNIHKDFLIVRDNKMQVLFNVIFPNVKGLDLIKRTSWFSPSYGNKVYTSVVDLSIETDLPTEMCIIFNPGNDNLTTKAWRHFMTAIKE
jgi:hypothetical protein